MKPFAVKRDTRYNEAMSVINLYTPNSIALRVIKPASGNPGEVDRNSSSRRLTLFPSPQANRVKLLKNK